jgi:hypothetical protein
MNSKDLRGSILLKLHHKVAMLILTCGCGSSQEASSSQSTLQEFKQVVAWTKALILNGSPISATTISSFSHDVGIIAPMFFVATNCPDSSVRGEALEILASGPRREGVWDAEVALKILTELNI